jgi:SAM-dependent methyltransferase
VLDVGCGSGRVPEPFIPFGIEISGALFERHMRGRGGWAVHAPALKGIGQFQTGYFSGIVLRSFLEHEVAPKAVLQESARVLADEGSIFVRVPNFGSVNRRVIGGGWCGVRHPDHVNYFTLRSLQKMPADCGLQVRVLKSAPALVQRQHQCGVEEGGSAGLAPIQTWEGFGTLGLLASAKRSRQSRSCHLPS